MSKCPPRHRSLTDMTSGFFLRGLLTVLGLFAGLCTWHLLALL